VPNINAIRKLLKK